MAPVLFIKEVVDKAPNSQNNIEQNNETDLRHGDESNKVKNHFRNQSIRCEHWDQLKYRNGRVVRTRWNPERKRRATPTLAGLKA